MTETLITREVNCETGEVTERPFTPEEIIAHEEFRASVEARREAEKIEAETKAAAKESALLKLAALGLTPEEIAAL